MLLYPVELCPLAVAGLVFVGCVGLAAPRVIRARDLCDVVIRYPSARGRMLQSTYLAGFQARPPLDLTLSVATIVLASSAMCRRRSFVVLRGGECIYVSRFSNFLCKFLFFDGPLT